MARFFPLFAALVMVNIALAATALHPSESSYGFQPVLMDGYIEYLGELAVKSYVEQKNVPLVFIQALSAEKQCRGQQHYTFRMIIKVQEGYGVKVYKTEVLQDASAAGVPPIINFSYFVPL